MTNFTPIQKTSGSGFSNGECLVFFGNKNLNFENLSKENPGLSFYKVRQTHSDIFIAADATGATEADAHYTSDPFSALLISTADCIPLMVFCSKTQRVAAIHAGWRGVANQISYKVLQYFLSSGSSSDSLSFFIGPHIRQLSFEVHEDALTLLRTAQYGLSDNDFILKKDSGFFISLEKIVLSQLESLLKATPKVFSVEADTKTNADYFSYRREQTKQRNLSFIARL